MCESCVVVSSTHCEAKNIHIQCISELSTWASKSPQKEGTL